MKSLIYLIKCNIFDLKYNKSFIYITEIFLSVIIYFLVNIKKVIKKNNIIAINNLTIIKLSQINWKKFSNYKDQFENDHIYSNSNVYNYGYNLKACLKRLILLKSAVFDETKKCIEKGVLLAKFNETFECLVKEFEISRLLDEHFLVLEPSWSGYADHRIMYWTNYADHKIIIQASELADYNFLEQLGSNLIPVRMGASDWVDHRVFKKISFLNKKYDIIYVAAFAAYKRHHVLFKTIKKLNDTSLKIVLVGLSWNSSRDKIEALIKYYGLTKQIDIYEDISQDDVNCLMNMSKMNILLSKKEGSNKSIFEGFFSGIPAIVLKDNIGVNKNYINRRNGLLVDEKQLGSAITILRDTWNNYDTREWALMNISTNETTNKLNNLLKTIAYENNVVWNIDIAMKVNSPEPTFFDKKIKFDTFNELIKYKK